MRSCCVFCGSSSGNRPEYATAAAELGRELAQRGVRLVYGGSHAGLMGNLADACLAAGGDVVGIIPQFLFDKEIAHRGLPDLRVVHSMHERKALMANLADAFVALPGGFGTFEEFFEALTWTQIGLQAKPCGVLNVHGYYEPLLRLADHAVEEGFLKASNRKLIIAEANIAALLERLISADVATGQKWIGLTVDGRK